MITYLLVVSESLLALYLIMRLLFDKAVLTKWTFLLVFTVFFSCFAQYFVWWLNARDNGNNNIIADLRLRAWYTKKNLIDSLLQLRDSTYMLARWMSARIFTKTSLIDYINSYFF